MFTDIYDPCLYVSSAQSMFYRKNNKPQMNADERRLIAFYHRKGREERKTQLLKSLYFEEIIRPGTRMTRITQIRMDMIIRVQPCDLCSITFRDSDTINNEVVVE
jgi:hypothetical protein